MKVALVRQALVAAATLLALAACQRREAAPEPTHSQVPPAATAAMLENDGVGQRSGTSPFFGLPSSQK